MQKPKQLGMKPTQKFLRIEEVRDDCLVLQDGTLRAVLAVSSSNFDLKSEEEQNAIVFGYQRFLNSLEFTIQILMQSRRIHISDYIEKLKLLESKQQNELLRAQTGEYIDFIQRLIENANIMSKRFFVVVPWSVSVHMEKRGLIGSLFGPSQATQVQKKVEVFEKNKKSLDDRAGQVVANLSAVGVRVARLTSPELIELMYSSYNFDVGPELDASKLDDVKIIE